MPVAASRGGRVQHVCAEEVVASAGRPALGADFACCGGGMSRTGQVLEVLPRCLERTGSADHSWADARPKARGCSPNIAPQVVIYQLATQPPRPAAVPKRTRPKCKVSCPLEVSRRARYSRVSKGRGLCQIRARRRGLPVWPPKGRCTTPRNIAVSARLAQRPARNEGG